MDEKSAAMILLKSRIHKTISNTIYEGCPTCPKKKSEHIIKQIYKKKTKRG